MESPEQKKFASSEKGEIFELLSNHRRRYTIRFCKENGSATLGELAEHIAALEQNKALAEISSSERKRVYTSLQQTHLHRLEDAGMIQYDGDTIELTDQAKKLEVYLDIVPEGSVPWSVYYLGVSVIAVVIVAAVWAGFLPSNSILSETVVMAAIVFVYIASAVAHLVYDRRYRLDRVEEL
jgi:hypothetical protein